ncbi:CRISPR-associated endonuclease/helicase Cas3 [Sphingomonas sp. SORGH_AS802]|uniref:CRISPR-associated helicase Cas3' n=2 Tax=unclassified Sphingomonas TaxID=196159 RepID=UPI00285F909F|nr:CRISPR-associated helicase Cas3' [Sphingomonas sp. SORGH_AS_0438]MDR6128574.1 CRISPR-associated endonuclease/helicase Cas3 [Sphingomonas sp. SORGH_AS_0438]MDR6135227.1 CRISPR-associated endonuclease/helicase Cas3 [Sphingomonas sp. SORGH_AS_0802]
MMQINEAWAKLQRDADDKIIASLPLVDHCLDVGAALTAILPSWAPYLEAAAGRPLTEQDRARLIVLAVLHDLGKANRGFQARTDRSRPPIGHTGPVAALLRDPVLKQGAAAGLLRAIIADWGVVDHFAAVMAHHGKPLPEFGPPPMMGVPPWQDHVRHWIAVDGHDPGRAVVDLVEAVHARWPLAWAAGPGLPDAPRFVALFAGLVTLADWLGSDTGRFPIAGPHGAARDGMRHEQAQAAAQARGLLPLETPSAISFADAFIHAPRGFQTAAADPALGPVALIEAETGSGKTEAALWRWLELRRQAMVDGLFFALPTRSAAVHLHGRVNDMLKRVWGADAPEAVLAVPGYWQSGDARGQALPGYAVRWDGGEPGGAEDSRWAAERANRFLAARVAVGTIDQALLGTLPVKHALFRASVLARSLLVVDEVHASDAYMTGLLDRLLDHHVGVGGQALLLSATLGAAARATLLKTPCPCRDEAMAQPYPALSGRGAAPHAVAGAGAGKRVRIAAEGLIHDPAAIAARAVEAARAGAAVLVVRNSVADAVAVAQAVAALADDLAFKVNDVATLHHGRFAPDDRKALDQAVEAAFGKQRIAGGRVLVGTQTLEQSLDIDADYLITDLAPIDVLLQRIGRLHRHARADRGAHGEARVLVLRPSARDLTPLLGKGGGGHGLGIVYPNLVQIESTLRQIEANPEIVLPRDNRRLVEGALHPEALAGVAREGGTAWINHAAERAGGTLAEGQAATRIALDLSQRFTTLVFGEAGEAAATRLGARDLLLDLETPLAGPFGRAITRIALPAWMVGRVAPGEAPVRLDDHRFQLGERRYVYDQWGLRREG